MVTEKRCKRNLRKSNNNDGAGRKMSGLSVYIYPVGGA